jgi:hypothetical protein
MDKGAAFATTAEPLCLRIGISLAVLGGLLGRPMAKVSVENIVSPEVPYKNPVGFWVS